MSFQLSKVQEEAVLYVGGPSIITAGAGSGKTRTLTGKIAHLVNDLGYDPAGILAITFTNKAAGEMKSRLHKTTGRSFRDFPWVRTFHSACFQILKEHCELLGYKKPLLIHSENQQKSDMKKVLLQLGLDKKYLNPLAGLISRAKNSGDPEGYLKEYGRVPRKGEAYKLYQDLLEQQNAVDFDDILILTRDLLKNHPDIREMYQNKFNHILIDEFQDSNEIQNQVVKYLLKNGNLTVVGDDYQSIYKFRGADPSYFINFPKEYPDARIFKLEENYRSTDPIVAAADALIAHNRNRMEKKCFSTRSGSLIQLKHFRDEEAEAEWVADKCWEYRNHHEIALENIAILYRTKFCSLSFERAMRFKGIPYKMMGGKGFFERREVQDINSYLISALNIRDDTSFERTINIPRRGIGPGAIKKILAHKDSGMSLQEGCGKAVRDNILPKKTGAALENLLDLLSVLRKTAPAEAIRKIVAETGYDAYMKTYCEDIQDYDSRVENIQQMVYSASQKRSIEAYLEDCALIKEDQDDADDDGYGVRLSTFHAAKGLEYAVVFVVAVEEGLLPHWRSVGNFSGSGSLQEDEEGIEEERRLMYVAMTRAAHHLHLSWSQFRKGEHSMPSRFLKEIPKCFLTIS